MKEEELTELSEKEKEELIAGEKPIVVLNYFLVKKGESTGTVLKCKILDSVFDPDLKHAIKQAARELGVLIGLAAAYHTGREEKKADA